MDMFEGSMPGETADPFAPRMPETHPALTAPARARIASELRERRADLLQGIQRHEASLAHQEATPSADDPERVTRTRQALAVLTGELTQTTSALGRLDAGTYGVCERCGAPIPLRRLQIVPSALRCGECTPQ
jgi:RNA polymerase-binding transcription factor DksA